MDRSISQESAVSAFSTAIIARSCYLFLDSGPKPRAPATDLPTEILLRIFHLVYAGNRSLQLESFHSEHLCEDWTHEEPLSPALFPFAIAAVCSRWCDVAATVPEFWTRMTVTVDKNPTDIAAIRACLRWSRSLPLDITVTRSIIDHNTPDEVECQRAQNVRALLRPHLNRIRRLHISVLHSATLPFLFTNLDGPAKLLQSLKLESAIDDGDSTQIHPSRGPLVTPVLDTLDISGRCLQDGLLKRPAQTALMSKITSVNISRYRPSGSTFSLSRLQTLAFEKLDNSHVLKVVFAVLIGVRLSSTTITDCKVNTLGRIGFTDYLTFENMDVPKNFINMLYHWNGSSLTLDNCDGVDDRPFKSTSEEECYIAPRMTKLQLLNCDRFTAPALKRFIQARIRAASAPQWGFLNPLATESDEEDMLMMNTKAIGWLDVRGRGPVITKADAAWLSEHVQMFSWDALQPDGKRHSKILVIFDPSFEAQALHNNILIPADPLEYPTPPFLTVSSLTPMVLFHVAPLTRHYEGRPAAGTLFITWMIFEFWIMVGGQTGTTRCSP
ncbi:uncharacterized protein F5147DRAFT_652630 [Suillus discolor]|uniref:F-box domain-containing protein n=1 Tax=Suillus discolor TaxID=1912936 RepID=A0A9P7F8J8_9AGAM|nr:uncharacterized protein F5147DRAFT_652630 [Suillus discolor]KAG2108614.1 hypothetical protein F5147DRAFT_652630 [Suillus discolor]